MRNKTQALGLDPNRWYGNVEHGALAVVAQETVRYVRNIFKYYITYKSMIDASAARTDAIENQGSNKD